MLRPDLVAKLTAQALVAVQAKRDGEGTRVLNDVADYDVFLCLGSNRCLNPRDGVMQQCPFCRRLPSGITAEQIPGYVMQLVGGM